MENLISDIRQKEDSLKKLKEDLEQLPKDVERKTYVDRIMDVVKNIDKQKTEINRILIDNKSRKQEMSKLTDDLGKTFKETEEAIYADAQKEEYSKQLYKNLVDMREAFNS